MSDALTTTTAHSWWHARRRLMSHGHTFPLIKFTPNWQLHYHREADTRLHITIVRQLRTRTAHVPGMNTAKHNAKLAFALRQYAVARLPDNYSAGVLTCMGGDMFSSRMYVYTTIITQPCDETFILTLSRTISVFFGSCTLENAILGSPRNTSTTSSFSPQVYNVSYL
jgi:hypothetical protein